ncbi:MAG: peptidase M14 [Methylobacteriaceae bacterium]|jgi:hypothetical protein|nr:peptidase M14 [Methylobacteriaceae bacterium]
MTVIFERHFERTLERLVADFGSEQYRGAELEAWVFEDMLARRQAEEALAAFGVKARVRAAYKPLLTWFLDADLSMIREIVVRYPVRPPAPDNRFLLEAYPLAALTGDLPLRFEPGSRKDLHYTVITTDVYSHVTETDVFAPNREHEDCIGQTLLSPTGWLRARLADGSLIDERLPTDFETLFAETMAAIADYPWGDEEPYFDTLAISARLPARERRLGVGEEMLSLQEALHEDFYFSLLELFQKKAGKPLGDRTLRPGQIVPDIRDGAPWVKVETLAFRVEERRSIIQPLAQARAALDTAQIYAELAKVPGTEFEARSRMGRRIIARYHKGNDAPVILSGGQHPNETTAIVGALRAAQTLAGHRESHFFVTPLENPDGYAVQRTLSRANPFHMHHAARYTAQGNDIDYQFGDHVYEKNIRLVGLGLTDAKLHINLHGYPSHEWTRPLSGYVPRGFELWTLPKGFFLVMRHHRDWADFARRLMREVTGRLADVPGLRELNDAQIKLYEIHAGATGFEIIEGFPCMISVDERHEEPLTLITEYPDETIYGEAFVAGHTAQEALTLAAYDVYQELLRDKGTV